MTLQELERALQPLQGSGQVGEMLDVEAVGFVQVIQQLKRVPGVFARRFGRPSPTGAVATVEGATSLGAAPQVHRTAALDGDLRQHCPARRGSAVDPGATVGKQATGRKHGLICH
jgi:hypothetical protein